MILRFQTVPVLCPCGVRVPSAFACNMPLVELQPHQVEVEPAACLAAWLYPPQSAMAPVLLSPAPELGTAVNVSEQLHGGKSSRFCEVS